MIFGYMEEIFERKEIELNELRDYDKILPWLLQDKEGRPVRKQTRGIRDLAKNLAEPFGVIERAEKTLIIEDLLDLEVEADKVEIGRRKALRVVREQLKNSARALDLPRLPRQPDIARIGEWSSLFAPMIEEIALEKFDKSVTSTGEWDVLESGERRQISREISRRFTGR